MASADPKIRKESARAAALSRWGHQAEARKLRAAAARRRAQRLMQEAARLEAELARLGDDAA